MKISILTPTYNRAELLDKLYHSLKINSHKSNIEIEWLIMDDGSTDHTKQVIEDFQKESIFTIHYYYQENQGKMKALNQLVQKVTGEYLVECDSDDYFTEDAFEKVEKEINKGKENIYAYVFLKKDQNGKNMGNYFPEHIQTSTMFDLYFKQGTEGEKVLVFNTKIRKQYQYPLEKEERFITEARMYHQMDLSHQVQCANQTVMICEYKKDGYSQNINQIFIENPNGYYEYFREMFDHDRLKGVSFSKKLYIYKHYILFTDLSKEKNWLKKVKGMGNKMIITLLYLPGKIATKRRFSKMNKMK